MAKRRPSGDGMVRKREDGRWEGRIVVGHKNNGEPIYKYVLAQTQAELTQKLHDKIEMYRGADLSEECNMVLSEWLGRSKKEAHDRGMELLQTVGLAAKAENYPDELSGGQKQRVAIARALAMEPEILLFDEPTSALDPTMVGEVLSVIKRLADDGLTMLIVTHEMNFAKNVSNRIFYMDEGVIYEDGTPQQIFENPQKEKTRRFIKQLKVLSEIIDKKSFDFPAINSSLEAFGLKLMMSQKRIYKMQLAFEEIVMQKLVREKNIGEIRMDVEYSEKDGSADMIFSYGGEKFDPLGDEKDLIVITLKGVTSSSVHRYDGNKNVLVMTI